MPANAILSDITFLRWNIFSFRTKESIWKRSDRCAKKLAQWSKHLLMKYVMIKMPKLYKAVIVHRCTNTVIFWKKHAPCRNKFYSYKKHLPIRKLIASNTFVNNLPMFQGPQSKTHSSRNTQFLGRNFSCVRRYIHSENCASPHCKCKFCTVN